MKKSAWLYILLMCVLAGCSADQQDSLQVTLASTSAPSTSSEEQFTELTGDAPPSAWIEYDGERYDAKRGSYCWVGCVDMSFGPIDQLAELPAIVVQPGEKLTVQMEYEPMPNQIHVSYTEGDKHIPVGNEDFTFHAPEESGRYYYSIFAKWTVEDQEDVTRADSIYYIVVEVQ